MAKVPRVDQSKCIGCGACAAICGNVFALKAGKATVINPKGAPEKEIRSAIDGCPAGAISWAK